MWTKKCSLCGSTWIVIVVSPSRRAFCKGCGAKWSLEKNEEIIDLSHVSPDHPSLLRRGY